MPAGRPLKYKTPLEMQVIIDKYFAECDPHEETKLVQEDYKTTDGFARTRIVKRKVLTEQQPYTMAGLARRLGMARQTLIDYKNKDAFLDTVREARAKVEEYNERFLMTGKNVTGGIFLLKVNHQYKENEEDNKPPENPIQFINNVPINGPQMEIHNHYEAKQEDKLTDNDS